MLQNNWISKEQHEEILAANSNALSSPSTYALEKSRVINERKKFHHKLFKTPKETAVSLVTIGENKVRYRKRRLFSMGIIAGIFVAFGCFVGLYCSALFQWPTPTTSITTTTTTTTTTTYPLFLNFTSSSPQNSTTITTSPSSPSPSPPSSSSSNTTTTTTTTTTTNNDSSTTTTTTTTTITQVVEMIEGNEIINVFIAKKLIYGATFPIGLLLIILFGGELFSGNTMTFTVGLLCRTITVKQALLNYSITLVSNLIGTAMIALMAVITKTFDQDQLRIVVYEITQSKVQYSFQTALFKGIGCNLMICLSVFAVIAAEDTSGKTLLSYTLLSSVAFMAFEHTIANGFTVPLGMMYGSDVTIFNFIFHSFIPVTLGNLIGGMIIGTTIYTLYLRHEIIPLHIKTKLQPGIEGRAMPMNRNVFEDVPILQRTSEMFQRLSKKSVIPESNHSEAIPLLSRRTEENPVHPL